MKKVAVKKITKSEKSRLSRELKRLSKSYRIEFTKARFKEVELEMYEIFEKRIRNGSLRLRAFMDTVDDISIKYQSSTISDSSNRDKRIRDKTRGKSYSPWSALIAIQVALQLFVLVATTCLNLPILTIWSIQLYFICFVLSDFLIVSILIISDKNQNTDVEFEYFHRCQTSAFWEFICSPIKFIVSLPFLILLLPLYAITKRSKRKSGAR